MFIATLGNLAWDRIDIAADHAVLCLPIWGVEFQLFAIGRRGAIVTAQVTRDSFRERLINAFGCAAMAACLAWLARDGFLATVFVASGSPQGRFVGFRADLSSCHQPPSDQKQITFTAAPGACIHVMIGNADHKRNEAFCRLSIMEGG